MIRLVYLFLICAALAAGFSWLASQPGSLSVTWLGYQIDEIPIFLVVIVFLVLFFVVWFLWWMIRVALGTPGALGDFFRLRRNRKGLDALSKGMVAVGAGDVAGAQRQAIAARKLLADNPLSHLLEAQAAQMRGDENRVKAIYTEMLDDPDSEVVALRGLYTLARKAGDDAAARRHAERALRANPSLAWASDAMMAYQSGDEDWPAALVLIESQRRSGVIDRDRSKALKAVVMTAQAMAAEGKDNAAAADLALKAHKLDPALVLAAVIAGRVQAEQGHLRKASKVLEATWKLSPHPDIAEVYRHARMGDSVSDRLVRMRDLLAVHHGDEEGAVALATAAIEALDWKTARAALRPYLEDRPRVRICTLMAEIEQGEFGDAGKAREWTARAVRAPDDPAWTADGYVSPEWLPASPTTGRLGAFAWKVPVAALAYATVDEVIPETVLAIDDGDVIDVEPEEDVAEAEPEAGEAEDVVEAAAEPAEDLPDVERAGEPVEDETASAAADGKDEQVADVAGETPQSAEPQAATETAGDDVATDDAGDDDRAESGDQPEAVAKAPVIDTADDDEPAAPVVRQPDDPGPRRDGDGKSWFGSTG
jgi:HemY protein